MPSPRPAFDFQRRRLAVVALTAAWLLGGCGSDARGTAAPTIVFVSIDTLAAGHTSLHGYARDTTPRLRQLAEEAVVFEQCWANAAWTTPSYMAQFTGLYPDAHRVVDEAGRELGGERPWFLFEERTTLAEQLRRRGYRTAAFVDNPNIPADLGLAQGFEVYDTEAVDLGAEDPEAGIRSVIPRGLAWLDSVAGGATPAFLFLQAIDPHAPYSPAPEYAAAFTGDGWTDGTPEVPVAEDWEAIFRAIPRYVVRPLEERRPSDPPPARYPAGPFVDAYDREIAATDAAIGALVDALRDRGRLDEIVLVISADHGESMLEDGSYFSHQSVQEEVLHVPLLMRLPGGHRGGTRVRDPVQSVDLFPTLLELAGAKDGLPAVHGASLVPLLEGQAPEPRGLYAAAHVFRAEAVRDARWKLSRVRLRADEANVRALLSHPAAAPWLSARLELPGDVVVGTRASTLEDLLGRLGPEEDVGGLLGELEAELARRGPRLFRYGGAGPVEVDPSLHPDVVERLEALLERARATALAGQLRGVPAGGGELDETALQKLRDLGY